MSNLIVGGNRSLTAAFSRPIPKYFQKEEMEKILSDEAQMMDYRTWFLGFFLWETGLRISEALSLKVGAFDSLGGFIQVKTLKRKNHYRTVPIRKPALIEFINYISLNELKTDDRFFYMARNTAYERIEKLCRAGIGEDKRNHPHTFRHSFAIKCVTQGVPIPVLKEWLGHADILKTMIYAQVLNTMPFVDKLEY